MDAKIASGDRTTKGMVTTDLEENFNYLLNDIDYECNVRFGQGWLSGAGKKNLNPKKGFRPAIVFCRKDILKEHLVNRTKLARSRGFYIWFAYYWLDTLVRGVPNSKDGFHLSMGRATNKTESERCEKCLAYEKFFGKNSRKDLRNKYEIYPDLETDLEKITNYFLKLVDFFNEIPQECFKPMDNLSTL
ncbi:hypothetical protein NHP190012_08200 [Helicobacter sp. NHP19-012]|uniref:Uncharacterized protein n=2 Tax=Helicobacteraceae TaxID=72293 RepID=A0ABN6I6Q6_9HELI|nr:hypothetical protein NHP190012_08200 [Helicobacter sp. NHP19-012]GMB95960.1 hypothetical protein NHP22001_05490 [Helicobacter sp. NHP22-001]